MTTLAAPAPIACPAPAQVLKYASGETARSGRQVLLRSSLILAIIVVLATIVYAVAWVAEEPNRFMEEDLRVSILDLVPRNLGMFIAAISMGGLLVSAGHWLQARPIAGWRLFCILILIHMSGVTLGISRPERPRPILLRRWIILSPGM